MQTDPELSDEIRRFEQQYAENPDSLVFARLADLHRKAGRPERALEILDEGLERHPDYLSAHIVRARCLRVQGRTVESEDVFRHVLDLDGENLVALRSLAEMAWERGDDATARDRLEELLELDPRNEEARDLLEEIRGGPADGTEAGPDDGGFATGSAASGAEDESFGAEDDPFAAQQQQPRDADDEPAVDDPFEAPDDPFAAASDAGAGMSEPGMSARDVDPDEDEVPDAEEGSEPEDDLIIEPSSRREAGGAAGLDEEPPSRAFDVEPVAGDDAAEPGPDDTADDEDGGRWWDFLRPGGGSDELSRAPGPDEGSGGGPAVGPGAEAEELRAQIEELRMRAEQETDLSDADEDLATETLANLYEAQGFYREAVEMYEELAAQRPEDEELRQRLERAREALEETGEPAVTAAEQLRAVLRGDASPEGPAAPGS